MTITITTSCSGSGLLPACAFAGAVLWSAAAGAPLPAERLPAVAPPATVAEAEAILFQTDHLHNVARPATLRYTFRKTGSLEPGFDDVVKLQLGARRTSTVLFLSGARQWPLPDLDNAEGNPVLLGFLERDIAEMHRLTGGSSSYFRRRIRLALATTAQVQPRRFVFQGTPIDGRQVLIEPYRNDPMHERFERFTGKRYLFLLGAQLPGGVYQVSTIVAGPTPAQQPGASTPPQPAHAEPRQAPAPLIVETLTLVDVSAGAASLSAHH